MKIDIDSIHIGISFTIKIRKPYTRNGIRYARKKFKIPHLSCKCTLKVYGDLQVGGVYVADNTGEKYLCTFKSHFDYPISELKNVSTYLPSGTFTKPVNLTLIAQTFVS